MEIITGVERRRRWRPEEKLQIVAETEQPGACFAEIARRYDVSRGLLWNWRSQARWGVLAPRLPAPFLPVHVLGDASGGAVRTASEVPRPRDKQLDAESRIEIGLPDGTVVRVGSDVSAATLRRVMAAVRRLPTESGRFIGWPQSAAEPTPEIVGVTNSIPWIRFMVGLFSLEYEAPALCLPSPPDLMILRSLILSFSRLGFC